MDPLKKLNLLIFFILIISNAYSQGSTNGSVKTYYTTLYDKGVKFYEGNVLEQDEEVRSGNSTVKVKKIYKHGQGTSFLNNSTNAYKKGNFYYDNLNGHGEMHVGAIHYVGNWKDNKKNGIGKEWSDGSDGRAKFVYEGGFVNDRYNGKGKFVTDNFTYEGGYSNHNFSGQGKITYSDGGTYSGMFSNGLRSGYGEFYYANGDVYRGNWLNNNRHGEAEYFFSNTKKTERLVFENNIQKSAMVAENKQANSQSSGTATNQTTSFLDKEPIQSSSNSNTFVSKQEMCIPCAGSGKKKEWIDPYSCQNCVNWNESYRSKVPCHVCKDTRVTPNRRSRMVVCSECKGTGRDFEQERRNKEFGGLDWMLSSNKVLVVNGTLQVQEGIWRPRVYGPTMSYQKAEELCQSLGPGWRIPTLNELELLFSSQVIQKQQIGNDNGYYTSTYYWSSSKPYSSDKEYERVILNAYGDTKKARFSLRSQNRQQNNTKDDYAACKCVRSN